MSSKQIFLLTNYVYMYTDCIWRIETCTKIHSTCLEWQLKLFTHYVSFEFNNSIIIEVYVLPCRSSGFKRNIYECKSFTVKKLCSTYLAFIFHNFFSHTYKNLWKNFIFGKQQLQGKYDENFKNCYNKM